MCHHMMSALDAYDLGKQSDLDDFLPLVVDTVFLKRVPLDGLFWLKTAVALSTFVSLVWS